MNKHLGLQNKIDALPLPSYAGNPELQLRVTEIRHILAKMTVDEDALLRENKMLKQTVSHLQGLLPCINYQHMVGFPSNGLSWGGTERRAAASADSKPITELLAQTTLVLEQLQSRFNSLECDVGEVVTRIYGLQNDLKKINMGKKPKR